MQEERVTIGAQCPQKSAIPLCKSVEFDNIKVFYHQTYLNTPNVWSFYIARPRKPPSDCIYSDKEGIIVNGWGPDHKGYDYLGFFVVQPGDRARIPYHFGEERREREVVFPNDDPCVPVHYLEE